MIDTLYSNGTEIVIASHSLVTTFWEWVAICITILALIILAYAMGLNNGKKDDAE
jgi:hypothetical protein